MSDFGDNINNSSNKKTGRIFNVLGLAKKAGVLAAGSERVLDSVRKRSAVQVYISSDASENTVKKLSDKTAFYNIPSIKIDLTMDELAHCIGCIYPTAAVSLTDKNFLKLMEKCLKDSDDTT